MNPQQFAALAAKYLARTTLAPHERQEYGAVEDVLRRLSRGDLVIGEPKKPKVKKETPSVS